MLIAQATPRSYSSVFLNLFSVVAPFTWMKNLNWHPELFFEWMTDTHVAPGPQLSGALCTCSWCKLRSKSSVHTNTKRYLTISGIPFPNISKMFSVRSCHLCSCCSCSWSACIGRSAALSKAYEFQGSWTQSKLGKVSTGKYWLNLSSRICRCWAIRPESALLFECSLYRGNISTLLILTPVSQKSAREWV